VILVAVVLWVGSLESVQWSNATHSNTIKAYQEYLAEFSDGKHAEMARTKLDALRATRDRLIHMGPTNAATRVASEMVNFTELFQALERTSRADSSECSSGMDQPGSENKLVALLQEQARREKQAHFVNWLRQGTVHRPEEGPVVVGPAVIITRTIDALWHPFRDDITPKVSFKKDGFLYVVGDSAQEFKLPCATTRDIMSLRTLIVVFRDYADLEGVIVDWPSARIKARCSISGTYKYSNPSGLVGGGSTKRTVYWDRMWAWIEEQAAAGKDTIK